MRTVAFIIPCYNEEETLPEFHRRVAALDDASPDVSYQFFFVNDGSTDDTRRILDGLAARDGRAQVLHLAQNRGHQIAVTAGLDFVAADAAIIIDADLQDPPELAGEMVKRLRGGADVVHARRASRLGDTPFKRVTASVFYRLLNMVSDQEIVADAGDFRAISRRVVETVRGFREPHRYLRGIFSTIGFNQETLDYERDARYAGETKYPFRQMMRLATNAIFSFSTFPIKFILWASLILWLISGVYVVRGFVEFLMGVTVHGWASIVLLLSFYSGVDPLLPRDHRHLRRANLRAGEGAAPLLVG